MQGQLRCGSYSAVVFRQLLSESLEGVLPGDVQVLAFMDRQSSAQNLKVALLGLKCAIPVYHDNKHNRFLTTLTGSLLSRTNWNRGMLLCNSVSVQKINTTLETLSQCTSDCKKFCEKALQSWRYRAKGAQAWALGSWRQNKVFLGLWSSCRAHSFHELVVRFFPHQVLYFIVSHFEFPCKHSGTVVTVFDRSWNGCIGKLRTAAVQPCLVWSPKQNILA